MRKDINTIRLNIQIGTGGTSGTGVDLFKPEMQKRIEVTPFKIPITQESIKEILKLTNRELQNLVNKKPAGAG